MLQLKKIFVHSIADYQRDPDIYHKIDYDPFGWGSETWVVWYFMYVTPRKKNRLYLSYGRTEQEASIGLMKACRIKNLQCITKERYREVKRENKRKRAEKLKQKMQRLKRKT